MSAHPAQHPIRARSAVALLALLLMLATGIGTAAHAQAMPAPSDGCLGPVAGQHIYDCAHLLTPTQITTLEADAAAVERAGAPTVVYLQVRDATAQQAWQDAVDLMNRWNVESTPGAHDGLVLFFDLKPDNLRHGQVALYAGAKHANGNLPVDELTRIRTDVMTPLLANGQTAEGIAAGLQMVRQDLQYGPPPPPKPPAYQTAAATLGRIPFNMLAALMAGIVALLFVRLRRRAPLASDAGPLLLTSTASPGDLSPALAGALVQGRVSDGQVEATVLDFARRGLLVIEPTGKNKVSMRLTGDGKGLSGYEREVWDELAQRADGGQRALSAKDLGAVRKEWSWPKTLLRRELTERGWYDPEGASTRRRPLYIAGAVACIGAAAGIVLIGLSQEGWALIGVAIFSAVAVAAFVRGYSVRDTTVEGQLAAAPWRAYRDTVTARTYEPNLDTDLPYVVALALQGKLASRLKAASERGYAPAWFRQQEEQRAGAVGFYPYWVAFHTSMAPASAGSASGSYGGGGAAGGGAGSAGGF